MKETFSPSFLKTAETCMYAAVNAVKDNTSPPLLFGNIVHDVAEKTVVNNLTSGKAQAELIYQITNELGLETFKYLNRGQKAIGSLFNEKFQINGTRRIFDVESRDAPKEYRIEIGKYNSRLLAVPVILGGRKLWGKIDRLDLEILPDGRKKWIIIDYKTGSTKNDFFQILCYAVMVTRAYGINPDIDEIEGQFWYLEKGDMVINKITTRHIISHIYRINNIVASYDSGIHQRAACDYCRFCLIEGCEARRYKHYTWDRKK